MGSGPCLAGFSSQALFADCMSLHGQAEQRRQANGQCPSSSKATTITYHIIPSQSSCLRQTAATKKAGIMNPWKANHACCQRHSRCLSTFIRGVMLRALCSLPWLSLGRDSELRIREVANQAMRELDLRVVAQESSRSTMQPPGRQAFTVLCHAITS